jgi:hypothetical protein
VPWGGEGGVDGVPTNEVDEQVKCDRSQAAQDPDEEGEPKELVTFRQSDSKTQ